MSLSDSNLIQTQSRQSPENDITALFFPGIKSYCKLVTFVSSLHNTDIIMLRALPGCLHIFKSFFFPFQFCLDIIEIEPCNDLTSYHDEVATTIRLVNTIISSLYFLLSLTYFSPSPPPLSSSNHLFVLCIYDSVFL